jgi:hypothetical protein
MIDIYIYIYVCVCVCVFGSFRLRYETGLRLRCSKEKFRYSRIHSDVKFFLCLTDRDIGADDRVCTTAFARSISFRTFVSYNISSVGTHRDAVCVDIESSSIGFGLAIGGRVANRTAQLWAPRPRVRAGWLSLVDTALYSILVVVVSRRAIVEIKAHENMFFTEHTQAYGRRGCRVGE